MTSRLGRWWKSLTGVDPPPAEPAPPPEPARPLRFVTNPDLEAKVDAAGDAAAWAIYGDWLQTEGDARGELLALMAQGTDDQAAAWVLRNHDALFGSVARFTPWLKNKKLPAPFVRYAPPGDGAHRQRTVPTRPPVLIREVEWEHGFVARASIDLRDKAPAELADLLTQFLRLPIARFLRELGLGVEPYGGDRYPELFHVLEGTGPKSLKRLVVGDFVYPDECEMSWANLEDVSSVFRLKNLDALTICGGGAELGGPCDAGHLRAFTRQTGGLTPSELDPIVKGTWSRLERFELWLGSPAYGGDCTADHVAPLLEPSLFPALTHLALKNAEITDDLIGAVGTSRLLPRVRVLDLSMGTLGPDGAQALIARAGAFAHLARLDLANNFVPPDLAPALTTALPCVTGLDHQRNPDDSDGERYCAVSE